MAKSKVKNFEQENARLRALLAIEIAASERCGKHFNTIPPSEVLAVMAAAYLHECARRHKEMYG